MNNFINLQNDSWTIPTIEMINAIKQTTFITSRVDNDVVRLETLAAEIFQKDAALFVLTGTQANLLSIFAQTEIGDTIIAGKNSFLFRRQKETLSTLRRIECIPFDDDNFNIEDSYIEKFLDYRNKKNLKLLSLEIPSIKTGGNIIPFNQLQNLTKSARSNDLMLHLDGSRLLNACVASKIPIYDYAKNFNSITMNLNKTLCAPMGALVVGDKNIIEEARKWRKMLGGSFKQAGLIANAGIIALTKMTDILEEDHNKALFLANELTKFSDLIVNAVQTNIIHFSFRNSTNYNTYRLKNFLEKKNIWINSLDLNLASLIVNKDIEYSSIRKVLDCIESYLEDNNSTIQR